MTRRLRGLGGEWALLMLVDAKKTASAYVRGHTCLNHVRRIAKLLGRDVEIVVYDGHDPDRWEGRGQRAAAPKRESPVAARRR